MVLTSEDRARLDDRTRVELAPRDDELVREAVSAARAVTLPKTQIGQLRKALINPLSTCPVTGKP